MLRLCLISLRLLRLFLLGRLAWLLRFLRLFLLLLGLLLVLVRALFLSCGFLWLLGFRLLCLGRLLALFGLGLVFLFLLRGPGLLRFILLFGSALIFLFVLFLLLLLCANWNAKSEQQEQTCCADNSESFHVLPPLLRFPVPGVMRSVLRLLPDCEPRALARSSSPAFTKLSQPTRIRERE